jgi:hypothetical protein
MFINCKGFKKYGFVNFVWFTRDLAINIFTTQFMFISNTKMLGKGLEFIKRPKRTTQTHTIKLCMDYKIGKK